MREDIKEFGRGLLRPFINFLVKAKVTPNSVTIFGFIITFVASYIYSKGDFRWAGVILLFAGLCDVIDGDLARRANRVTKFGAFFDSTIDRFEEFFVFGGILYYYAFIEKNIFAAILIYFLLLGSIMTSYIRARAEGIGHSPKSGPMDRPGRYAYLIAFSIILGVSKFFLYSMVILLILVFLTVVNRFMEFKRLLNNEEANDG